MKEKQKTKHTTMNNKTIALALIILSGIVAIKVWEHHSSMSWEKKATVTIDNGKEISGQISWNSYSKKAFKLETISKTYVIPREKVKLLVVYPTDNVN